MAERESHEHSFSSIDNQSLGSNRNKVVTKKTTTVVPVSFFSKTKKKFQKNFSKRLKLVSNVKISSIHFLEERNGRKQANQKNHLFFIT